MNPNGSMARSASLHDDGISFRETGMGISGFEPPQPAQKSERRPEMRGPSDISNILSGLKTKTIDIALAPSFLNDEINNNSNTIVVEDVNNNSTISIDDLKSLQSNANVPKRSRRKPKSDKNTVSLDI
jgi:hypothetical protein